RSQPQAGRAAAKLNRGACGRFHPAPGGLYCARPLLCATACATFALSLNDDHGGATVAGSASPPRAESPMAAERSHLNPGFKVVSHASPRRRLLLSAARSAPA